MLVICVTLMAGLSGCEKEKPPLKVGFVGSLTGRYSDLGVAGRNGATLAVEHINEAGGIQGRLVELIVKDDKNDPDVAVQVDKELINEGVAAIIGHMTSSMSKAAVPLINEKQIVMVSPTTTTNDLTGLDDYFFRTSTPDLEQSRQLIRYTFNEQKLRTLAVVYDLSNPAYSEGWYHNAKAEFESLGGTFSTAVTFTSGKDAEATCTSAFSWL
jgi:branched-chain amino acid transport system substrate-binding protein